MLVKGLNMATFILTWNPEQWPWEDHGYAEAIELTARGEIVSEPWSVGNRRSGIAPGDRAVLVRQHSARGLVASGTFTSDIYQDEHWDNSGRHANYADVAWDAVLSPDNRLPIEVLKAQIASVNWDRLQASGIQMPDEGEDVIDALWSEHLRGTGSATPEGTASAPPLRRNPNWTRDELILALDLYLRKGLLDDKHPEVVELSKILNSLPIHTVRPDLERFRNPNGVSLKLANFAALDPNYPGQGMSAGGKLDAEVWNKYHEDAAALTELAAMLRLGAQHPDEIPTLPEEGEEESPEGAIAYRLHRVRERNRSLAGRKKVTVKKSTGRLACEVCGFEFEKTYGSLGTDYIEAHHLLPLSKAGVTKTKLTDLALLCSNCHRMAHRGDPWPTVEELRKIRTEHVTS